MPYVASEQEAHDGGN